MTTTETASNTSAPTKFVTVGENKYAYRQFGVGPGLPLVFFQHFTGTLDNWDPAITDRLARDRSVVLFENAGIGSSNGTVPDTVATMADHAMKFLDALQLSRDSHGGQEILTPQLPQRPPEHSWPQWLPGLSLEARTTPI